MLYENKCRNVLFMKPVNQNTEFNPEGLHPSSVFHGGEGLSPHYLNCTAHPHDLRPSVDITLKAIDDRLAELPEDKVLVVLIGEIHSFPAHRVYQQLLASRLLARGENFAMAMELPHNSWSITTERIMNVKDSNKRLPPDLYYNCGQYDTDGHGALSAFLAWESTSLSPVSKENLIAFCYHNNIKTVFNDAAFINGALDLRDSFTMEAITDYDCDVKDIGKDCEKSVAIRNLVMAKHGLDYASKKGVRVLLQSAGLFHIFGLMTANSDYMVEENSYKDSLCPAYRRAGAEVLPVFTTLPSHKCGINRIPEESYPELQKSVILEGINERSYNMRKRSHRLSRLWGGEKSFVRKLQKTSGRELEFHDVTKNNGYYHSCDKHHRTEILKAYESAKP
ncbi:MAG: hypothetical protein CO093_00625 [Alphaproteobacteria bacterium CG_4_9_14_3_um_filter_47_13]|nr:MAG: hypothetical protein CO093_00625 [Alphaproteobacteria bacterium CG_4_9_14_3_um_filter_47_13]